MTFGQHIQLEPPVETNQLLLQPARKKKRRAGENIIQPAVYNPSISLDNTRRSIETQTFVGNVVFQSNQILPDVGTPRHITEELQLKDNQIWLMQCTNEKLCQENEELKNQNTKEWIRIDWIL